VYNSLKDRPKRNDIAVLLKASRERERGNIIVKMDSHEMKVQIPHEALLSRSKFAKISSASLSHAIILCFERSDSDLR